VVWTGEEMIVWGGQGDENATVQYSDGAAFNPETGEWRLLSEAPIGPRRYHLAVWTGEEMLVVGGVGRNDGAAYSPSTDTWRVISPAPFVVGGRQGGVIEGFVGSVWTSDKLVVWQVAGDQVAAYEPTTDRWVTLPGTDLAADNGALRWDGASVYAFGATVNDYPSTNELSVARLEGDIWEPLPVVELSTDEYVLGALPVLTAWTGDVFLAWTDSGFDGRTMALDPATAAWDTAQSVPSAPCEGQGEPVSAEGLVFAFGWCDRSLGTFDGGSGVWTEVSVAGYPTARETVWTGEELINWGDTCCYGTGGEPFTNNAWRYRPGD
jgi:hypothetical protein